MMQKQWGDCASMLFLAYATTVVNSLKEQQERAPSGSQLMVSTLCSALSVLLGVRHRRPVPYARGLTALAA